MGVVKGFKDSGIFVKISFIVLILATICAWIAYNSTGWGECTNGNHYGLWRRCKDDTYSASCTILDGWALGKFIFFCQVKYFIINYDVARLGVI